MFLKIFKTNYIMMNQFKFNKIFPGFTQFNVKKFMTYDYQDTNPYFESFVNKISIENNTLDHVKKDKENENSVKTIPTAEFLNKTSKLAIRKRKKRKYGKKISLRYR